MKLRVRFISSLPNHSSAKAIAFASFSRLQRPTHGSDATLDLWLSGANVDWNALYGDARPRRVPLPTYPFAKERYWIADRGPRLSVADERAVEESFKSLEDIINRIDDDTIDTAQAVEALKTLV